MIRTENTVWTFIFFCKLNEFSIDNVLYICLAKFDLAGHTVHLAGKRPVTAWPLS